MRDTRATLAAWNRAPWAVLREWTALSVAIAIVMLAGVWIVATLATPDPAPLFVERLGEPGDPGDILRILARNLIVLALHATACVAGFMAGSSIPRVAARKSGFERVVHVRAARLAILLVILITSFSLLSQAYALGLQGASISAALDIDTTWLIVSVLPHALPELTALFLPLAAWIIASRRSNWHQLLAAMVVTVTVAVPVLILTATVEVEIWPLILKGISPVI